MMLLILLCAVACIAYGIWEHKNRYSKQQFCEAKVVGYKTPNKGTLIRIASSALLGIVYPVVRVTMPDGTTQDVTLHTQIMTETLNVFPEFEIGGRVDVTFFGDSPQEAYLINHPMAETVVKFSVPLVIGVVLAAVEVIIVVCMLFI